MRHSSLDWSTAAAAGGGSAGGSDESVLITVSLQSFDLFVTLHRENICACVAN
jgi:hypothetical protein